MRRVVILSYTERGGQLNTEIADCLRAGGDLAVSCMFGVTFSSTAQLLDGEWRRASAFLFVGAAGIAVRHIAPFLTDKLHDPAVLVADEAGRFVIPILSGHVGGGVSLAREVADGIGAQAVVTTATDVRGRFAVDVFAVDNHLRLPDTAAVREISSAVLRGDRIELRTGIPVLGTVPAGVKVSGEQSAGPEDIVIGYPEGRTVCRLAHRSYVAGIGCKKGKSGEELYGFLREVCARNAIDESRIGAVASIDEKREEAGIWELARRLGAPFEVFSAGELARIRESVHASAFVERTVGVDNVCERSALCLARLWSLPDAEDSACGADGQREGAVGDRGAAGTQGGGYRLVVDKQARDGMTLALARFTPAAYRWPVGKNGAEG